MEKINITHFPRLWGDFEAKRGVLKEFGNKREMMTAWKHELRAAGFSPEGNHTWIKPGYAAVILPM